MKINIYLKSGQTVTVEGSEDIYHRISDHIATKTVFHTDELNFSVKCDEVVLIKVLEPEN